MAKPPVSFTYYPAEKSAWKRKARALPAEEFRALFLVCLEAYPDKSDGAGGTLPDDDVALSRLIGRRKNPKLLAVIRQHFTPSGEPGVLRSEAEAQLFTTKRDNYLNAQRKGRRGGRPRGPKPKAGAFPELGKEKTNELNSSGGGVPTGLLPPPEGASTAVAGSAGAAPADAPPAEHPKLAWARANEAQRLTLERAVDADLRARFPAADPADARFAAVRSRLLEQQLGEAWARSPEGIAYGARNRALLGLPSQEGSNPGHPPTQEDPCNPSLFAVPSPNHAGEVPARASPVLVA